MRKQIEARTAAPSAIADAELDQISGGPAFLKLEGVEGESTDQGHKDWINLLSVS